MIHPILFKDKCSCGGKLQKITQGNRKAGPDDEVIGLQCDLCKDIYFISWDIVSGEPKPLFSKEKSIENFLSIYKKVGNE